MVIEAVYKAATLVKIYSSVLFKKHQCDSYIVTELTGSLQFSVLFLHFGESLTAPWPPHALLSSWTSLVPDLGVDVVSQTPETWVGWGLGGGVNAQQDVCFGHHGSAL